MAQSSSGNPDDTLVKLVSTENSSKEIELPIEFEQSETQECVVCVQKTSNIHDIYTTQTISSDTSIHTFLSKYKDNEISFDPEVNKYICNTCLQLVNVLEHAEIQYVKLKCAFEAVISNNPLFRTPEAIRLVCEKEGTEQDDYNDTGSCSGDDLEAMALSVDVKIEQSSEDEGIHYGGLEDLVDTVMEPDPFDDDISFSEDNKDGAIPESLDKCQIKDPTNQDLPYECQICQRRFAQKYHLIDHEIVHNRVKHFECSICLRSYNRKGYLQSHIKRYHSGIKLFPCDTCPETFLKMKELRNHIKKHIGEGFKCQICNCEFKRKDNYQRHQKTHMVDKARPFECPICQKKFVEKPHLRNHLATHTGEKPFECTVCQCWFNRKGNLQRHMMRHTGEKPFQCEACDRRFTQKLHLQNHFRRKHTEKPVEIKQKRSKKRKDSKRKSQTVSNKSETKKEQIQITSGSVDIKRE